MAENNNEKEQKKLINTRDAAVYAFGGISRPIQS